LTTTPAPMRAYCLIGTPQIISAVNTERDSSLNQRQMELVHEPDLAAQVIHITGDELLSRHLSVGFGRNGDGHPSTSGFAKVLH
jgi:hypothetical protein